MPPIIIDTNPGTQYEHPQAAAYARQPDLSFELIEGAFVEAVRSAVSPSIGSAILSFEYGRIATLGGTGFTTVAPLAIGGTVVRIDITGNTGDPIEWYGVVTRITDESAGMVDDGVTTYPTGNQTIELHAIEWLFARTPVLTSEVRNEATNATVNRGIAFNSHNGADTGGRRRTYGNRDDSVNRFAGVMEDAIEWTAADMVDYLIEFHQPSPALMEWSLDATSRTMLDNLTPIGVETEGRSVYEILNQIIDRRLGYTWSLRSSILFDEIQAVLHVHTYTDVDAGELLANPEVATWDFEVDHDAGRPVIVEDVANEYQQVVVQGARRGACFSASYTNGLLVNGWTAGNETAYDAGASGNAGYAGWNRSRQIAANDAARSSDTLQMVFTRHLIDPGWDFLSGDPTAGTRTLAVCPALDVDGDPTSTALEAWIGGMRLENYLPLEGVLPDQDEQPRPFAVLPLPVKAALTGGSGGGDLSAAHYAYADRLASGGGKYEDAKHIPFSCHVRMLEDRPGFVVRPTGPPHLLAGDAWLAGSPAPTDENPRLDYQNLIATLHVSWDDWCEVYHPSTPAAAGAGDQVARKVIDVGQRGRLDWVCEGTVLGLETDGTLIKLLTGQFIRDDRPWMRVLAETAWAWYSTPRKAITVRLASITTELVTGYFLQEIGPSATPTPINSVVTSVAWDFRRGTTQVQTAFAELDWRQLAQPITT